MSKQKVEKKQMKINNFISTVYFQDMLKLLKKKIFVEKYKFPIIALLILFLAADVFFIKSSSDIRFFGIAFLFFVSSYFYKLSSKLTFIICLTLLGVMYVAFIVSGPSLFVEKISVWIVLLMVVGIVQQWKE